MAVRQCELCDRIETKHIPGRGWFCHDHFPEEDLAMVAGTVTRIETEADEAERHKAALTNALKVVIDASEAARLDGFYVEFGVNLNQYGRYAILPAVSLIKRF